MYYQNSIFKLICWPAHMSTLINSSSVVYIYIYIYMYIYICVCVYIYIYINNR